jgi:4-diphosphocytidyl-2C-methyl-D-erythritol kinase
VLRPTDLDTWEGIEAVAVNDFEDVVGRRHPEIPATIVALHEAGAAIALMSGSGSSVVGVFGGADDAEDAAHRLADRRFGEVVLTRTAERVERVES